MRVNVHSISYVSDTLGKNYRILEILQSRTPAINYCLSRLRRSTIPSGRLFSSVGGSPFPLKSGKDGRQEGILEEAPDRFPGTKLRVVKGS